MTKKQLAYSILVVVIAATGCGSSPVKKPKDSGPDMDGTAGGSGGSTGGISGGGGSTGGISGSGGATGGISGSGGAVVEPPAQDAGLDANPDAVSDAQPDATADAVSDGGDASAIVCSTPPLCTVGDKRCTAGGLQTCALINGCANWGADVACGANRTCTGTGALAACACTPPPAACTAAGNFCESTTVRATCEMVNGCLGLAATKKTCGASQTCTGTLPNGDCVCAAAPTGCTAAGTFCPTTTTVATCTMDADGCLAKSGSDTTCMNGQICVKSGNTASCQCPATVGTTLGTACNTIGQTVCDGAGVLTCQMNATSGCKAWVLTTDCAANNAGLVCGTQGGLAACQCPAVTDGKYYVDPVAGTDVTTAAPFATGAKTPAACRFKTLIKASNVATNSGNQIIAVTATPPGVFTEAQQISIAGGVTLTTDDATPTPANYRIDHTGSTADTAIVVLGTGSIIKGFTLRNAGTNPGSPVVGLRCTIGTVTVDRVNLEGTSTGGGSIMATGLQIGTAPINTCTGTFSNMVVDGFATNIFVSTSAGTAPVINSTKITNTAPSNIGLELQAGTLTTNNLRIEPHAGTVSAGFGVIVRPGSPAIAASYVGNSTSIALTSQDAVWLDSVLGMAAPQATLSNVHIEEPSGAGSSGIVIEGGTLNLTGTLGDIVSPEQHGIDVQGGAVIGTGLIISNASGDGVHVTGATTSVTLHKTTIRNSTLRNLFMDDGAVLLDDGSVISGALQGGIEFAAGLGDTLTIGSPAGDLVDIGPNTGHGVSVTGAGSATTSVIVRRSKIHDNTGNGVNIALSNSNNSVTVENTEINANHTHGLVVNGAPSTTATNSVLLDNLNVHHQTGAAGGKGIWLNGNLGTSSNITATINQCQVHDNRDVGVQIDEDMVGGPHTSTTRTTMTSNDIHTNNPSSVNTVAGGIWFATSSALTSFTGNKIHNNGKDQVVFSAGPTTGTVWDLDPGSCTSTTNPDNQIYCYSPTNFGLRATNTLTANPPAYTVDADHVTWAHTTPTVGNRDFTAGADTTITVANPCTPAVTTCP